MRTAILMLLAVGVVASAVVAQPKDGDLIVTIDRTYRSLSFTAFIDPTNPGMLTTIAVARHNESHSAVRMAADNTDMMLAQNSQTGGLGTVSPGGNYGGAWSLPGDLAGFRLDHDGTWVVVSHFSGAPYSVWELLMLLGLGSRGPIAYAVVFVDNQYNFTGWNDVVIDRDPGASPYAVTEYGSTQGRGACSLVKINRTTSVTSKNLILRDSGPSLPFELDPRTGDHLHFLGGVVRTDKSGRIKATYGVTGFQARRGRITQDHNLWIAGYAGSSQPTPQALTRFDLNRNIAISTTKLNLSGSQGAITGIEVYGSRRLVCNQQSSTVNVNVQSRRPGDANKSYTLACSRARRPGVRFPNGEWLDLDVTDPLFWTSAVGAAPSIFQNFQGTTDANGNATAQVNIPSTLPPNLGITVFVAGVIYDNTGVLTVTNTHWFVL